MTSSTKEFAASSEGSRNTESPLAKILQSPAGNVAAAFVLLQVLLVVAGMFFSDEFRYLSPVNISLLLKSMAVVGVLAVGVGVLMVAGEFDLSVGSVMTFTAIVMATLVQDGLSVWLCFVIALGLGAAIGFVNGFVTLKFGIPSFITTLAGLLFFRGLVLIYHGASSLRFKPTDTFRAIFGGDIAIGAVNINMNFVWLLIAACLFYLLLHKHRLGSHIFAVGGGEQAAHAIGVNVFRTKMIAFMICGAMAAFAGVLSTTRVLSVLPGQGTGLELLAIAACVIGGFALKGGRGAIFGAVLGAAFIYTIQDVLLLLRVPGFWLDSFVGAFLVVAAVLNSKLERK